jgi:histone deacetylase 6
MVQNTGIKQRSESSDGMSDELATDGMDMPHGLPQKSLPSGVCYDARMRFHAELDPSKDRTEYHPEDPRRIYFIYKALCQAGLVDDILSEPPLVAQTLVKIPARQATRAEVCLVHTQEHFDYLQRTASKV